MPKELTKNEDGSFIGVHWYNHEMANGSEYISPLVAVVVSTGEKFEIDGEEVDALYFNFDSPGAVAHHIKALKRAKRKVFGTNLTMLPKF